MASSSENDCCVGSVCPPVNDVAHVGLRNRGSQIQCMHKGKKIMFVGWWAWLELAATPGTLLFRDLNYFRQPCNIWWKRWNDIDKYTTQFSKKKKKISIPHIPFKKSIPHMKNLFQETLIAVALILKQICTITLVILGTPLSAQIIFKGLSTLGPGANYTLNFVYLRSSFWTLEEKKDNEN